MAEADNVKSSDCSEYAEEVTDMVASCCEAAGAYRGAVHALQRGHDVPFWEFTAVDAAGLKALCERLVAA